MSGKVKRPKTRRTGNPNHVGLSPLDEHRLRRRLRRAACSEPWVDEQIKTLLDIRGDGNPIIYRFHDPKSFPPGGRIETAMKWCRLCGRYTPPNSIHLIEHTSQRGGTPQSSSLRCDDCRIGIDAEIYRELYDAGLFLRPTGSMSFVRMLERLSNRKRG